MANRFYGGEKYKASDPNAAYDQYDFHG